MPLTFIAGIYGMNFENMPELQFKNGYFIIMALMGVIAIGMIFGFYRIGWLGMDDAISDEDKQKINR
jgi:magnesium transporter